MKVEDFFKWLNTERLMPIVEANYKHFKVIFEKSLSIKDEKVLILGDYGYPTRRVSPILTGCYVRVAQEMGKDFELSLQDPKIVGEEAEGHIVEKLLEHPEGNIIIGSFSGRIGSLKDVGKSFRRFCRDRKHRFVSTMSLGDIDTYLLKRVINPIAVDYDEMNKRHAELKKIFDDASEIRVRTAAGTDVTFDVRGVTAIAADGVYHDNATGGNIPAGEVYLPPANANGRIIIDVSSRNSSSTMLIRKPFVIEVRDGKVVSIEGDEEADLLDRSLKAAEARAKYPERIRFLAELGIGLNPKAKVVGSTIIDEKTLGTAHVAIGSNYWFGGKNKTIIHLDQIFKQPRIYVDGRRIKP